MKIRKARLDECDHINAMIMRSKAHWGYDDDFMDACREELTLGRERLLADNMRILSKEGLAIGIVELVVEGQESHLSMLFVDPHLIGGGAGRILYEWALGRAKSRNANSMFIAADPGALGFYKHMGAEIIGSVPSGSIPGRNLPYLKHMI